MRRIFYRYNRAHDNLELFFVSAVSSLLLLRLYLHLAGYPQVSGGSLHIAHMLWGGVLMLVALVSLLSFIGYRVQHMASFIGGVGFGIFIDELGKFITKDNNYFFRPTIGILYAIFCIIYLSFNFLGKNKALSSEEYQLNALRQLEEAVLSNMDAAEKTETKQLLDRSDQNSPITKQLKRLLSEVKVVKPNPTRLDKLHQAVTRQYFRVVKDRARARLMVGILLAIVLIFSAISVFDFFDKFEDIRSLLHGQDRYNGILLISELVASAVASIYAVFAAIKLTTSRLGAIELFRRAVLVNLLLTEFFAFTRIQFRAMPGFIINLVILTGLHWAIKQERHATIES